MFLSDTGWISGPEWTEGTHCSKVLLFLSHFYMQCEVLVSQFLCSDGTKTLSNDKSRTSLGLNLVLFLSEEELTIAREVFLCLFMSYPEHGMAHLEIRFQRRGV